VNALFRATQRLEDLRSFEIGIPQQIRVGETRRARRVVGCDRIRLDVEKRELMLLVADDEMKKRREASPVHEPKAARGYLKLFLQSVTQADQGVDFDFLRK